jgi:hypothetical protein
MTATFSERAEETVWLLPPTGRTPATTKPSDRQAALQRLTSVFAPFVTEHTVSSVLDHHLAGQSSPAAAEEEARRELADILADF